MHTYLTQEATTGLLRGPEGFGGRVEGVTVCAAEARGRSDGTGL